MKKKYILFLNIAVMGNFFSCNIDNPKKNLTKLNHRRLLDNY